MQFKDSLILLVMEELRPQAQDVFRQPHQNRFLNKSKTMGNLVSRLWWEGDPDEKDRILGLSRREVYYIQTSWKVINENAVANGLLIFTRLFESNSASRASFKRIVRVPNDQLSQSTQFNAHIHAFMSFLDLIVRNLPQPDLVVCFIEKLGNSHRAHKLKKQQFLVFREVVLKVLKTELNFEEHLVASWSLFFDFFNKEIFKIIR